MIDQKDKILVVLLLGGGFDGMGTFVPTDQLQEYYALRTALGIPEGELLNMDTHLALHPAAQPLREMYDNGEFLLVQGCHYPNPSKSHFDSIDVVISGSESELDTKMGQSIFGQLMDLEFPAFPAQYPNPDMSAPPVIAFGNAIPKNASNRIDKPSIGIEVQSAPDVLQTINNIIDQPAFESGATDADIMAQHILSVDMQLDKFGLSIYNAYNAGTNDVDYPEIVTHPYSMSKQLQDVARLIKGGLGTRVYFVSLGGFDTHSSQIGQGPTDGTYANLITDVFGSVQSFFADLGSDADRVLAVSLTEFGRRMRENAGRGTDHGTAAPTMLFGPSVRGGIIGDNDNIKAENIAPNGDLISWQHDIRGVWRGILEEHMGAGPRQVAHMGLMGISPVLGLVNDPVAVINQDKDYRGALVGEGSPVDPDPVPPLASGFVVESKVIDGVVLAWDKATVAGVEWTVEVEGVEDGYYNVETLDNDAVVDEKVRAAFGNLSQNTRYYARIKSKIGTAESLTTELIFDLDGTVPVAPPAPRNLRAHSVDSDKFAVIWDIESDPSIVFTRVWVNGQVLQDSDDQYASYNDAVGGESYYVEAATVNSDGLESAKIGINIVTPVQADTTPPSVPANFMASQLTHNSVTISWAPSIDNVEVKEYVLSMTSELGQAISVTVLHPESLVDGDLLGSDIEELQPNTSYNASIYAADEAGNISGIVTIEFTTPEAPVVSTGVRIVAEVDGEPALLTLEEIIAIWKAS